MPTVIQPTSDPDELRAAQAAEVAVRSQPLQEQPSTSTDASEGSVAWNLPATETSIQANSVPASVYPTPGVTSANQAIAMESVKRQQQRHIGLYVIVGLVLLSAISTFLGSESTPNIIIGIITALVGLGLLARYEIARIVFVVVELLSVILGGVGLLGGLGSSAALGRADHVSGLAVMLDIVRLSVSLAMVIYMTRPSIKDLFA